MSTLDASTCALLRRRGWQHAPRKRAPWLLSLLLVLAVHVLFTAMIWHEMQPPAKPALESLRSDQVMQVRFFHADRPPSSKPPPPPPTLPKASLRPAVASAKPVVPSRGAVTMHLTPAKPARTPRLYGKDGQLLLPASSASVPPVPGYVQRMPQGDRAIMRHDSPITYRPTRFNKDWTQGGNLMERAFEKADRVLSKAVQKTTYKTTIRLPRGVRIHCGISLAMLAGGCGGDPPPPPSKKDGDERLSMAPVPLAKGMEPANRPTVAQCITIYRAGKPLPWGCPVDTPNRAVDAEQRERAEKAARQH